MAKIQRQMCLSVPQCNRTAFPCLPFTQNMHQGHRIRAATGRAKIVHYHGLKASRKTRSREVVLRPRSASRNNRMSSCCRRNVQCSFPLTNTMIPRSCSLPNIGWSSVAPLDHFLSSKKSRNVRPWSGCRWLNGTNAL